MLIRRHSVRVSLGALLARWACLSVVLAAGAAAAQMDPHLTGSAIVAQLAAAQSSLAQRATAFPQSPLSAIGPKLQAMGNGLRKALGNDADKPLDKLDDETRARAARAYAATQQVQAYLNVGAGCQAGEMTAMASALAVTINGLAAAPPSSKGTQPVINAIQTRDNAPLFAVPVGASHVDLTLVGANLYDARCEYPVVSASDEKGGAVPVLPAVTGVLPERIDVELADTSKLVPGSYVLHVVSKSKGRLFGCKALPEAVAAIQIVPPAKLSLRYTLGATCGNGQHMASPVSGSVADLTDPNAALAQHVTLTACPSPVSYTLSAQTTSGNGDTASVGPLTQSASASITAGLPGGVSLTWDPSVQTIFVRASTSSCTGYYRTGAGKATPPGG